MAFSDKEAAARALEATVARLRAEVAGLRRAMRHRAVIEQAKGVMAARFGVPPEQAFDHLLRLSQDTNTKVAGVAAAVVGTATPDPPGLDVEPVVDEQLRLRVADEVSIPPVDQPAAPQARPPEVEALHTFHQIVAARTAAARDHDEVAEALALPAPGWPQPRAVSICMLEPDGALRLVGAHGLTVLKRSRWLRMPPQLEVPVTRAVRCRAPVVASAPELVKREFPALADSADPPAAAVALPLTDDDEIVGSVGLSWSAPLQLSAESERYLFALADPVSVRIRELAAGADAGDSWLSIPLEAMHDPAVLLTPVPDDAAPAGDFRVVHANTYARAHCRDAGVDVAGATLLSLFPYAGSQVLLAACRDVLTGTPLHHLDPVRLRPADLGGQGTGSLSARITAVSDKVLLVWHPHTAAEASHRQLLQAETVARIGSFRWDADSGVAHLSPHLMNLLQVDDERLTDLGAVIDRIHQGDRKAARRLVRALLTGSGQSRPTRIFRGAGRLAGRWLQVTLEPPRDGAVIVGTVQDITEQRLLQDRLRQAEMALAGQRQAAAVRESLAAAMLPAPGALTSRHMTADGASRPAPRRGGGGWYDAAELPDGDVLLMAGQATGDGTEAMVGAGRIRHAVRSYALVRHSPADILAAANALVRFDRPGLTASVVLARYTPVERRTRWAAAGSTALMHFPGRDVGTILGGSGGPPLGAAPSTTYQSRELSAGAGDRLLLCTWASVDAPISDPPPAVRALSRAAAMIQPESVAGTLDQIGDGVEVCAVVARFDTG